MRQPGKANRQWPASFAFIESVVPRFCRLIRSMPRLFGECINVKALGLNRAESMFRSAQYLEEPKLPSKLGYEAAGIVESVGSGVQGFKPGDAVSTIPAFPQGKYGVYGDVAVVPAAAVAKHPPSLSWTEAAIRN